jgi:hypothetical protein
MAGSRRCFHGNDRRMRLKRERKNDTGKRVSKKCIQRINSRKFYKF